MIYLFDAANRSYLFSGRRYKPYNIIWNSCEGVVDSFSLW